MDKVCCNPIADRELPLHSIVAPLAHPKPLFKVDKKGGLHFQNTKYGKAVGKQATIIDQDTSTSAIMLTTDYQAGSSFRSEQHAVKVRLPRSKCYIVSY